jgi:hypothetical protein
VIGVQSNSKRFFRVDVSECLFKNYFDEEF